MRSVFISSAIGGFEAVRSAVREAITSMGLTPVMAETVGASALSPRRALLDEVARADVYLLLLGQRYGDASHGARSPTEDEFEEARRRRKPVLVLAQDVPMEGAQEAFRDRVAGGWKDGRLWGTFTDENDVALKTVRAIVNLQQLGDLDTLAPPAQARAAALVEGQNDRHHGGRGARARLALVPLVSEPLLDDLALEDPSLPDRLSENARSSAFVPHRLGIRVTSLRDGVQLDAGADHGPDACSLTVSNDGAIVVEAPVGYEDPFKSNRIDPGRLDDLLVAGTTFASRSWTTIDLRDEVQQVAVALGTAGASALGETAGDSARAYGVFGGSANIVVPDPPRIVRRSDIETADVRNALSAALRRAFGTPGVARSA